jgi:hypothetical protein
MSAMRGMEDGRRLECAEALLTEAVFRSREAQAASGLFRSADGPGSCGLGERAVVARELTEKGRALLATLWSDHGERSAEWQAALAESIAAWVVRQDALDRDRNHFIKAFRRKHGFDRQAYGPEQVADYERGLDEVNAEESRARRAAAVTLRERGAAS